MTNSVLGHSSQGLEDLTLLSSEQESKSPSLARSTLGVVVCSWSASRPFGRRKTYGWYAESLARRTILCGGFPCQDLSVAGRRAGLDGARSGLFFEFARIAEELELAQRGGWVFLENVPGLLSSDGGRDFGVVLQTLADLGFAVGYRVLDSRYFGVPQRRRRVFIVGHSRADYARAVLFEPEGGAGSVKPGEAARAEVAGTLGGGSGSRGWCDDLDRGGGTSLSGLGLGSGGPDDNDAQAGRLIPALTTRAGNTQDDQQTGQLVVAPNSNAAGRRQEDDTNLVVSLSENQRAEVLETEYAHQLTTGGGKMDQGYSAVRIDSAVRRLTPRECERLQGFPDDWTAVDGLPEYTQTKNGSWRAKSGTPDSKRYSAMGDAVTATGPVSWLAERIVEVAHGA